MREERASGSENGDLIESYIRDGKIVPVEITISLIEKVLPYFITHKFSSFQMVYIESHVPVGWYTRELVSGTHPCT